MNLYANVIESPIGPLTPYVDESGRVYAVDFGATATECAPDRTAHIDRQLREYFDGTRTAFDFALTDRGTPFQRQVWALLVRIPYGVTRSYGELAVELGNPGASRAVGRANATNPVPILVPCHRVIGTSGHLTGFAGGLDAKKFLLDFERRTDRLF